jgi:hypothetical protein
LWGRSAGVQDTPVDATEHRLLDNLSDRRLESGFHLRKLKEIGSITGFRERARKPLKLPGIDEP